MAKPTYNSIARRAYRDDGTGIVLTEDEARVVAAGWVGQYYCLELYRWVCGVTAIDPTTLLSEAHKLLDDLALHRDDWPHAGAAEPSIAAASALVRYLQALRDKGIGA
ncbi:hypothetical protein NONI108955_01455 [Nocardia ninae]|uniref:Uncharacterized protein n=1 Tax=Nocardia ninae NBRC 108245 TaxID=1210091 RepID=A0A511MDM0_9NOCA|nr:hypothetical protein [Nocardia ninae]GEM38247.1 hypothetical protein NN4_27660 [Nocardia ninae NBRC 108245]